MSRFFDTNILIYAQQHGEKADVARRLIGEGGLISVQVINEFTQVSRRKFGRPWREIDEALSDILEALPPPLPVTMDMNRAARRLAEGHGISFYDALIVAAARDAGCAALMTEDLQDGRRFEMLAVINPFAAPMTPLP